MPLYDCVMLMKSNVKKEMVMDLVARVGKRVYQRKGVITDLKSFGTVQLAYGIKKLDGKHFQGQLMQMTMMVPPSFNKELQYLNKEDRLLRWLVVKHRANATYGLDFVNEDEGSDDFKMFSYSSKAERSGDDDDDDDDDEDEVDDEHDAQWTKENLPNPWS